METSKTAKILSNVVYGFGLLIFLALAGLVLFGANYSPYPDAMISWSLREIAFVGLAVGAVPMLFACMAVYKFNHIRHSAHKRRDFTLIFLPCFLCGACLAFVLGLFAIMMIQALILAGSLA